MLMMPTGIFAAAGGAVGLTLGTFSLHSGAASYTRSYTIAAGLASSKLIAAFAADATGVVSNVRWGGAGGTALTQNTAYNSGSSGIWFYYLDAPADGTADLYFDVSDTDEIMMLPILAVNAAAGAFAQVSTGQGASASTSNTEGVTVGAGGAAFDLLNLTVGGREPVLHGSSAAVASVRDWTTSPGHSVAASRAVSPAGGTVTLGWTWPATAFRNVAAGINLA